MHDTSVTHRFIQAVEDAVDAGRPRRVCLTLRGMVQGVGFRPFVFRLATELGVAGWVSNSSQGACVEVEGEPEQVEQFLHRRSDQLGERAYRNFGHVTSCTWTPERPEKQLILP